MFGSTIISNRVLNKHDGLWHKIQDKYINVHILLCLFHPFPRHQLHLEYTR